MTNKKKLILLGGLLLAFAAVYFFKRYGNIKLHISPDGIRNYILSYGKFSALIFIIIYSLKPVVFVIPASVLSVAAGNIFGPLAGFSLSMISSFIAATIAFYLARIAGRPFVDKLLKGKTMNLNNNMEKHGFFIILIMRLCVIFHFDGLGYAAGLSKIRYKDFISATLLGIIPEMLAYSFMGNSIKKPFSPQFILPVVMAMLMAMISFFVFKKYKKE